MGAIRGYIDQMGLKGGYDKDILDDLTEKQVKLIIGGYFRHLFNRQDLEEMAEIITRIGLVM